MLTTTRQDVNATITQGGKPAIHKPNELVPQYQDILTQRRLSWTNHLQLLKLLGSGGQGVVYQTELRGTDEFTLPAALKIFSPERFDDVCSYDEAMQRIADVEPHPADDPQTAFDQSLAEMHTEIAQARFAEFPELVGAAGDEHIAEKQPPLDRYRLQKHGRFAYTLYAHLDFGRSRPGDIYEYAESVLPVSCRVAGCTEFADSNPAKPASACKLPWQPAIQAFAGLLSTC